MAKPPILDADPRLVQVTQGNFVDVTVSAYQRRLSIRAEDNQGEETSLDLTFRPLGLIQVWSAEIDPPYTAQLLSSTQFQSVWRVTWPS